jgi:restriction system protein
VDLFPVIKYILVNSWWLIPFIGFLILAKSPWLKGQLGELIVILVIKFGLDKNEYRVFHNVLLSTPNGTTQIDHVLVSRFGIFVVETKHMKGWIFGDPSQPNWTQVLYNQRYNFQNPLRQNYKHVKTLEVLLNVPPELIHSVIVFTGSSVFKTPMPHNVIRVTEFISYLRSKQTQLLTEVQIQAIAELISSRKLKTSFQARREHVRNLHDAGLRQYCPKCGSPMVLRTAKHGVNQGKQFWGCSQYPNCRATRETT